MVEDNYLIASDLKRALQDEGATVVGPTGRLDRGLALLDGEAVDAAVLDVNLGEDTTLPIADQLGARAIPCLFVTGYDGWSLPDRYRDAPRVTKPFTMHAVLDTVAGLVGAPS